MTASEPSSATLDVRGALREAIHSLREANVPSHTLAAELLLMHALGRDRAWLYAHPEEALDAKQAARCFELVERRAAGVPTQYLTGKQEFWGLEFEVTPAVLIPRPETEHVVEVALERLGQNRTRDPLRIADVGTGSGCLAIALARELPAAQVFATDISAPALEVARRNATRLGVSDRIDFIECGLLEAFVGAQHLSRAKSRDAAPLQPVHAPFDLIVSNPPYVGRAEEHLLPRDVREHEPAQALIAGESGFEVYAPLVRQARELLRPGGLLVLELGYNSLERVDALVSAASAWIHVSVTQDLAGIPRVLAAERA